MTSPFPGMDPYLEAPDIWPDFHAALSVEISGELNCTLLPPYYSRLSSWHENSDDGEPVPPEVDDERRGEDRDDFRGWGTHGRKLQCSAACLQMP